MTPGELLDAIRHVALLDFVLHSTHSLPSLGTGVAIGLVAALSTLLGHSFILFINRLSGLRFLAALLLGSVFITSLLALHGVAFWIGSIALTGHPAPLEATTAAVLASMAPLSLGFLVFIPHLGILIGRILQGWQAICLWLIGMVLLDTTWWQALLVAGSSWLLMQLGSRLFGRPLGWIAGRTWTLVTGRSTMLSVTDVLAGAPFVPVEARHSP